MNKPKFIINATKVLRKLPLLLTFTALTGHTLLTGCASVSHKDESIDVVLRKENVLIEKLKAERAQPDIVQSVSENEALSKAEVHLGLGLEEILKANETIKTKILKQNKKEVQDGENERSGN